MAESFPPSGYYLRIKDWEQHFEISQSKRVIGPLSWVPLPTRQDGLKFSRLMRRKDGVTVLGAFTLLLEIAGRSSPRGSFISSTGRALSAQDFAVITGARADVFTRTIKVLISDEIGWLELGELSDQAPRALVPSLHERRGEERTREEKRGERESAREAPPAEGQGHTHTPDFSPSLSSPNGRGSRAVGMVKEILGTVPIPVLQERMVAEVQDLGLWNEVLVYWRNNKHGKDSHGLMLDRYGEQLEKRRQKASADDPYAAVRERVRKEGL